METANGTIKEAIRRIDESMVPGSGVTTVSISRAMCALDLDSASEVVKHYREKGYVADARLSPTIVDFVIEPNEIR
jgi:hypothetical protein